MFLTAYKLHPASGAASCTHSQKGAIRLCKELLDVSIECTEIKSCLDSVV